MYETIKAGENIIYICIFIYVWENISYMHNNNIGRYFSYRSVTFSSDIYEN